MTKCDQYPMFRYTWPGQNEAMICLQHALQMGAIAQAMGLYLQFIPLDPDRYVIGECSQEIRDAT